MDKTDGTAAPTPEHSQRPTHVRLDTLIDGGCREIDPEYVLQLSEHVDDLPPITVDAASLKVVDGSHRLAASRRRARADIGVVYVETVDEVDLIRQAVQINDATDRRSLSREDRREAIRRVLEAAPSISNRDLAEACGMPESTARSHRRGLVEAGEVLDTSMRRGRDGKSYPARRPAAVKTTLRARIAAMLRRLGRLARSAGQLGR